MINVQDQRPPRMEEFEPDDEAKQEAGDLMRAIHLSQMDNPIVPLSADGVVLLRLSRMARAPCIMSMFRTSEHLEHCRRRVGDAGCEMFPSWTEAKLLVPLSQDHLQELEASGVELNQTMIVALQSDIQHIEAALLQLNCTGKRRPKVAPAEPCDKRPRQEPHNRTRATSSHESATQADADDEDAAQADAAQADADDDEGPVELEVLMSSLRLRTDSDVGMPSYSGSAPC